MPGTTALVDGAGSPAFAAPAAGGHQQPAAKPTMTAKTTSNLIPHRLRLLGWSVKRRLRSFGNEGLPVPNLEADCENKCTSPYIGERFGENSVGGKWLIGAGLRIPLTLLGRRQGAVGG